MPDDPSVIQLVTEVLDSGRTPEDVCKSFPDQLDEVRRRVARCRELECRLDLLFSPSELPDDAQTTSAGAKLPEIPLYQTLAMIGEGGMGLVYKAHHLKLKRMVALKMLRSGVYASPAELGRFALEAEAIAGLQHPHIVQIHDSGEVDGRPYFTMEYLAGGSLAQKLGGAPLPAEQAVKYLLTLASAVEAAHRAGIVHRDLKPANVLFSAEGQLKVSDFGLARRMAADDGLTFGGARIGTPSYMAPEQAAGRTVAVGPSADIYALGAILYEMLTGRPPFKGASAAETERQVINDEPAAPRRLNTSVPRDLETICLKCLQKDVRRRYPSAEELGKDLTRFQRGEPILARKTRKAELAFKWVRRHPAMATGIVGCVMFLCLMLAAGVWFLSKRASAAAAADEYITEAVHFQQMGNWSSADAALDRASVRLGAGGPAALRRRLELASRDSQLIARLSQIHLDRGTTVGSKGVDDQTAQEYAAAFKEAGLGTRDESPEIVANRISHSTIYPALIDALDDWTMCHDVSTSDWIPKVARIADRDHTDEGSWRRQFRDNGWVDPLTVIRLAKAADFKHESVGVLLALADLSGQIGVDPLPLLKQIQAAHPDDYWANFALANFLVNTHDFKSAIRFYQAAIALHPDAALARNNLGTALVELDQVDEGIAQLQEAVRLRPDDAQFHGFLGDALWMAKRFTDAIPNFEFELQHNPHDCVRHFSLADCYTRSGQFGPATEQFRLAIGLAPAINKAQSEMREGLIRVGRGFEFQVAWKWALQGDRSGYEAFKGHLELCLFNGSTNEYQQARAYVLNQFGDCRDVTLGEACLLSSEPGETLERAAAVVERGAEHADPDDPEVRFARALCEYRRDEAGAAIALLQADFPPALQPSARIVLAMAQFHDGQADLARKTFSDVVQGNNWDRTKSVTREQWMSQVLRREAEKTILSK